MSGRATSPRRPLGTAVFLGLQVLLAAAAVGWGILRVRELEAERGLPALRPEPLAILPLHDDEAVVGDVDLRRVISRLGLRSQGIATRIGHVDHSLRLWGPGVRFDDPEMLSGDDLRRLVTDHRSLAEMYDPNVAPLLIDVGPGVRVRVQEGDASTTHYDHTLAALAEVGTALDFPITTRRRQTTFRAVVEQSLRDFSLNQAEAEWSALAYALYLPPVSRWITSEGQEVSFDRLAARLRRESPSWGVCSGNHRLHAQVMFLRADDLMRAAGEPPILSAEGRRRILEYLAEVTALFVRHQHPDGFWNGDWATAAPAASEPSGRERDRLTDRLIATGHVLEWWALSPPELHPPRPVLAAAGQWLVRTIDALSPEEVQEYYTYLSHAGRALALWRGRLPSEIGIGPGAGADAGAEAEAGK